MAEKKESKTFFIRGTAVYPKTSMPYRYDKALKKSVIDKEEGQYSVGVAVDADDAAKLMNRIEKVADEAGLKANKVKNWPFADEEDAEGNTTGRVIFNTKGYALKRDGSPNRIVHFDKKAKPLGADFRLTGGSEVIVEVFPKAFKELNGGVRLNINAIQVINMVEYEGRNPFAAQSEDDDDDDEQESTGNNFQNEDSEEKSTDF
jgi:hypothetical protein